MKLIFERSVPGHCCSLVPKSDVPAAPLPEECLRQAPPHLPEVSETEISRHYTELSKQVYGVNDGFYPLGSCTMKYNPAVNEEAARLRGFTSIHPLQPMETVQGSLEALYRAERLLCEVTGMAEMTFQPAAGAHGELTGLLLIKKYHEVRGDAARRKKIIVPDSAHGTNPASAAMAGFTVVNIPSNPEGGVDIDALRAAADGETAGLMLTNPNTLGIFDPNILEITQIVHEAGGLCYYDGANLNAIVGNARPGDMGFDVIHLNLHKTFSTPHGGGGPGSGPVGVKPLLAPFLPAPRVAKTESGYTLHAPEQTLGQVKAFCGNFLVVMRALCYILMLGGDGLREASGNAVLNANYLRALLAPHCKVATDGLCMHEFVLDLSEIKKSHGVSAMDIAKGMLDEGMHAPTMYFPLIVHEALMFEPTETESKVTLDEAAAKIIALLKTAEADGERLHNAPSRAPVGRPDDVKAARQPVLRYSFEAL